MRRPSFENVLFAILTLCMLTVTALVIRRELARPEHAPTFANRRIVAWRQLSAHGNAVGPSNANIRLVIFADFECPYCRKFAPIVDSIHAAFPTIRIVERAYPLREIHPHAYRAALAAECAGEKSQYWPMRDALYANEPLLVDEAWAKVAERAGIHDTTRLLLCMNSPDAQASVLADTIAASSVGVPGTPTVVLDDIAFGQTPTFAELSAAILAREGHAKH